MKKMDRDYNEDGSYFFAAGTRPKKRFQNRNRNASDLNIPYKYEKHISGSIRNYEEKWNYFYKKYLLWKNERLNTISKLQDLRKKVHDEQLEFNETNVAFKELNIGSRKLKDSGNSTLDFFASLGTFLTDAASGITSIAQAINVDENNTELKKIMEDDAEITKPLYIIRSECLEQYRGVEEIIREFHSETFEDTWGSLSKSLKLDKLWLDLKNVHENNLVLGTIQCLDRFVSNSANFSSVSQIYDSFGGYLDGNPAVLDACKSAGKALYEVYDACDKNQKKKKGIEYNTGGFANQMILYEEENELSRLRSKVNNREMTQAKLESKIKDAIDSLQTELNEMSRLFNMY